MWQVGSSVLDFQPVRCLEFAHRLTYYESGYNILTPLECSRQNLIGNMTGCQKILPRRSRWGPPRDHEPQSVLMYSANSRRQEESSSESLPCSLSSTTCSADVPLNLQRCSFADDYSISRNSSPQRSILGELARLPRHEVTGIVP